MLPYASLLVDGVELARSGVPVTLTGTIPLALGEEAAGELETLGARAILATRIHARRI